METHINTKVPLLNTLFFVRMVIDDTGPDDAFQLHVTGGGTYEAYLDVVELTGAEIPAFKVIYLDTIHDQAIKHLPCTSVYNNMPSIH